AALHDVVRQTVQKTSGQAVGASQDAAGAAEDAQLLLGLIQGPVAASAAIVDRREAVLIGQRAEALQPVVDDRHPAVVVADAFEQVGGALELVGLDLGLEQLHLAALSPELAGALAGLGLLVETDTHGRPAFLSQLEDLRLSWAIAATQQPV